MLKKDLHSFTGTLIKRSYALSKWMQNNPEKDHTAALNWITLAIQQTKIIPEIQGVIIRCLPKNKQPIIL